MENYKKSQQFHYKALNIRKEILGEGHQETANSYNNLALLYFRQNNYVEAYKFIQKAILILKKLFPNGHPNLEHSLNALEIVKRKLGLE